MTEPTPTPPQQPSQEPTPPQQPAQTPPWGTAEQFQPDKAWSLIQNLRGDLDRAKSRPVLTDEQQAKLGEYDRLEQASKSELQRIQEAHDAEKARAETATAEALRMRVALSHGIPADYLDLIGSGNEEQVNANAERVAALIAAQRPATLPAPPAPNSPHLQPGAVPTPPPGSDVASRHAQFFPHRTA